MKIKISENSKMASYQEKLRVMRNAIWWKCLFVWLFKSLKHYQRFVKRHHFAALSPVFLLNHCSSTLTCNFTNSWSCFKLFNMIRETLWNTILTVPCTMYHVLSVIALVHVSVCQSVRVSIFEYLWLFISFF